LIDSLSKFFLGREIIAQTRAELLSVWLCIVTLLSSRLLCTVLLQCG